MKDIEDPYEMGSIYISSEQIIQEVQKFKCLYDPADPDHKDRDVMRDAWLSVSQAVVGEPWEKLNDAERNEAAERVEGRWKMIRETYRKSFNISETPMLTNEQTFQSEAEEFRSLSDTDDTIVENDEQTEISSSRPVQNLRPKRSSRVIDYLDEISLDADEPSLMYDSRPANPSPRSRRKKHMPRQITQTAQNVNSFERDQFPELDPSSMCTTELNSFSVANYPSTRMPEPENPDRLFLLSLLPRVNALSSRNKLDFQIKAMQLLRGIGKDVSNL